jgi:hypothetical protein
MVALVVALLATLLGPVQAPPAGAADLFPTFSPDEFVTLLERAPLPGTTPSGPPPPITYDAAADARIVALARATDYRQRPSSSVGRTGVAGVPLNPEAADALLRMQAAARAAGAPFTAVSGFRSHDDQRRIFLDNLAARGRAAIGRPYTNREIAAGAADRAIDAVLVLNSIPGFSLHHTGDAVDLTAPGGSLGAFAGTAAYRWLAANNYANAKAFGFVPSYPVGATAIGPEPEPWEYTYVGVRNLRCAANVMALADRSPGRCPVGSLDLVVVEGTRVTALGWTADADAPATPLAVHIWVDGAILPATASVPRADVAAATPFGPNHGYEVGMDLAPGPHLVCAFGLNDVPGEDNTLLGCTVVTVRTRAPVGALDRVVPEGTGLRVDGWTADPDRPGDVLDVHLYVDGVAVPVAAGLARPDVAAATPYGAQHGYSAWLAVPGGPHTVCAFAISPQPAEGNPRLGCRSTVALGTDPYGTLDRVTGVTRGVRLEGWAVDGELPGTSLDVHLYLDGAFAGTAVAATARPDVDAVFGVGPDHGFSVVVAADPGPRTACAFAIAATPGEPHRLLGCRVVTVPG